MYNVRLYESSLQNCFEVRLDLVEYFVFYFLLILIHVKKLKWIASLKL
jgi:hypothetical protein